MLLGKHGDYSNRGATEAQQKSMRELEGGVHGQGISARRGPHIGLKVTLCAY